MGLIEKIVAAKQDALDAISRLPDNADMDEIIYRLYVIEKIRKGREDVKDNRATGIEELKAEIETW